MSPTPMKKAALIASALLFSSTALAACGSGSSSDSDNAGTTGGGSNAAIEGLLSLDDMYKGTATQPPTEGPKAATNKNVWYISCGQQVSGCSAVAKTTGEAAKAIGWEFHVADGNLGIADGYTSAVRTAIAAKPDAIIVQGWSCDDAQQALQEANDKGIKIIGFDNTDCSDVAGGGPELFNVKMIYSDTMPDNVSFWEQYGKLAASYIINTAGTDAKIINNPATDTLGVKVDEGFKAQVKDCSGCSIVDTIKAADEAVAPDGPWIQGFRSSLVRHPDANAAFIPWDFMMSSVGGAQAIKESGLKISSAGGLGTQDGLDLVRNGTISAITGGRDVGWAGWAAIDQLNRAFNGEKSVPQGIGFVTIDKDHNLPKPGTDFISPVDYQTAYKKIWGK